MHDLIQQVDSMNAPKCNSLKHDGLKFMQVSECNMTSACLIVCLKKNFHSCFLRLFFQSILCLSATFYSKTVWRDKQKHAYYKHAVPFRPVNQSWEPKCTALHWLQTYRWLPIAIPPYFWRCYHCNQIPMLGLALKLISHENVFEAFQPTWSQSTNVADRQTTCDRKTVLHTIVHHELKNQNITKRTSSNVIRAYLDTTLTAEGEPNI